MMMTKTKETKVTEKLEEFRLHLPPTLVMRLRRLALERSERVGRSISWGVLAREALTAAAAVEGIVK